MSVTDKEPIFLASAAELDIKKTFECGQCFRWNADAKGVYSGVARGKPLRVWNEGGEVFCSADEGELPFWRDYFDLDTDYASAIAGFTEPEYLQKCARFGAGIRILKQEPWEALCSFIISQCNNIPRIKGIVEKLCRLYGDEIADGVYSFPDAQALAVLEASDMAELRAGYRAQYILNAARAVSEGRLDFDALRRLPSEIALAKVTEIHGVGAKVANCFLLYGMHLMNRFPIDVWMKRALKEHFPSDFDPASLGAFAGLAQQYIFYFARSGEKC